MTKKTKLYGLDFVDTARRVAADVGGRKIEAPEDVAAIFYEIFQGVEQEQFWVVLLNTRHNVIALHMATIGLVDRSQIHAREVYRWAVAEMASGIIMVHNHPSGDPTPSPQDLEMTKGIKAAGQIIGINVIDHVVTGNGRYISFREGNLL